MLKFINGSSIFFVLVIVCYNRFTHICVQWYNDGTHAKYVTILTYVKTEVCVERQRMKVMCCFE